MRRNRRADYITHRISQLMDDANKCHREEDRAWYNRIMQELHYVRQYDSPDEHREECVLETV